MKTPAWLEKYERPTVFGPQAAPIAGSRYTGSGRDGKVQRGNAAGRELIEWHEGETIISAEDTERNGGAKGVMKKLGIKAQAPMPEGPIQRFRRGGHVSVHKYQTGGAVLSDTEGIMPGQAGTSEQITDPYENDPAMLGTPISTTPNQITSKTSDPYRDDPAMLGGPISPPPTSEKISDPYENEPAMLGTPIKPRPTSEQITDPYENDPAMLREPIVPPPAAPPPEPPPDTGEYIPITDDVAKAEPAPDATVTPPPKTPTEDVREVRTEWDATSRAMAKLMQGIADMTSPIFKRFANSLFAQLNPQLQTQMTLTAMNIAQNPNMTEGQKNTAMAEALRNVGIAQSETAAQMAEQAMKLSTEAIQSTFNMAKDQQNFYEDVARYEKDEGWKEFEAAMMYGSDEDALSAYETMTGKKLDPAAMSEYKSFYREQRRLNIVKGNLDVTSLQVKLGDQKFESLKDRINGGATFDQVKTEFPDITQAEYDSIKSAGPLGDKAYSQGWDLAKLLIESGDFTGAASALSDLFPDAKIDFSKFATAEKQESFDNILEDMFKYAQQPGVFTTDKVIDILEKGGYLKLAGMNREEATKLYDDILLNSGVMAQIINSFPDKDIAEVWLVGTDIPVNDENIAKVRTVIKKAVMASGGPTKDSNDNWSWTQDAWDTAWTQVFGKADATTATDTETAGVSPAGIDYSGYSRDQLMEKMTTLADKGAADRIWNLGSTPAKEANVIALKAGEKGSDEYQTAYDEALKAGQWLQYQAIMGSGSKAGSTGSFVNAKGETITWKYKSPGFSLITAGQSKDSWPVFYKDGKVWFDGEGRSASDIQEYVKAEVGLPYKQI